MTKEMNSSQIREIISDFQGKSRFGVEHCSCRREAPTQWRDGERNYNRRFRVLRSLLKSIKAKGRPLRATVF